ncbi:hypothetical protein FRB96_005535 [Tulasnella sp. 330]|nr:hypothetical protein FRB96_005535 [Tulasnella sp. 330]KAG8879383.1 hypothetical protein FRB97_001654 [Tulasnella sp. 331]
MDAIKLLDAFLDFSPTAEDKDWFAREVVHTQGDIIQLEEVAERLLYELLVPPR